MEIIDGGLGMGYGTVLSPVLISIGFGPLLVVPSILISQAMGGFVASLFHIKLKNFDINPKSKNFKITALITALGIVATVFATIVAINIPKIYLNTYIGLLVATMGLLLILQFTFKFSFRKIFGLGLVSAFNKGMSGGGYGPIVTGGQLLIGHGHKSSICNTVLAEAPICIAGFLTYLYFNGVSEWNLPLALTIGAILGAPFGAILTKKLKNKKLALLMLAIFILCLGIWTLYKTWVI